MCHYQPWEDDSSALSEEDEEPRTGNNNDWESRMDKLEEHIARIGARFERIQERPLPVVSAMFLATLAYAYIQTTNES